MKNIEKYEKEISQLVNEDNILPCAIATVAGIRKEKPCYHQECEECHKKCIEWMYSDYIVLTEEEKDLIKSMIDVIQKFGCPVKYVIKEYYRNGFSYIQISYENDVIEINETLSSPCFTKDKFKGMELNRKYSLEELGITCPTQKDN